MAFYRQAINRERNRGANQGQQDSVQGNQDTTVKTPQGGWENECKQGCMEKYRQNPWTWDEEKYQACLQDCMRGGTGDTGDGSSEGCPGDAVKLQANKPYSGTGNCPCGAVIYLKDDTFPCPPGYRKVMGSKGPSCRCEDWCKEGLAAGTLSSGCTGTGKGQQTLGEFQWPTEITDLYGRLMGRANDILDMPYGYTQPALDAMFGRGFETVRGAGRATRESVLNNLGREGQLGTGTGLKAMNQTAWNTEKGIADLSRDVFLANEAQKRADLESYTNLANSLFGTGRDTTSMLEAINAARRGEAQNAVALFMQYIMAIMNSWKS